MGRVVDLAVSHKWLTAAFVSIIAYIIVSAIYNLYFSPLAKYPGPFLAKISGLPNFYHATTGNRHIWIWQCHEVYGDAFRFKPNGVLFSSPTAYQTIYQSRANVKKGKLYQIYPMEPANSNTLNSVDKVIHARKRRVLNSVFSEKAVRSATDFVTRHVDRWNELLIEGNDGKEWTKPQNMSELTDYLVFDIMGDLCFGKSFELKEPGENQFRHMPHTISEFMQLMYPISHSPFIRLWIWLKPRGLTSVMKKTLPPKIKNYYDFVDASVAQRQEEEAQMKSGTDGSDARKDMIHYIYNAKDDTGNPAYSASEVHAETSLLIVAGSDTTAITLSGLWFHLVRNPRVYAKLAEEIRTTFKSADDIQLGPTLSSCRYLHACIDEGHRTAPAGTSELPREVLPGGLDIEGQHIPEGTHVGVGTWTITHRQECYGDPWVFRPERWIVDPATGVTAEDVALARTCLNPFTIGQGNCVGQKLAMGEMLITVAKTLHRMDVRLAPGDVLGAGSPELGWGARDSKQFKLKDAYTSIRDGPTVQFRRRVA